VVYFADETGASSAAQVACCCPRKGRELLRSSVFRNEVAAVRLAAGPSFMIVAWVLALGLAG